MWLWKMYEVDLWCRRSSPLKNLRASLLRALIALLYKQRHTYPYFHVISFVLESPTLIVINGHCSLCYTTLATLSLNSCTSKTKGVVRYDFTSHHHLLYCNGSKWHEVFNHGLGSNRNPARSCSHLKHKGVSESGKVLTAHVFSRE